MQDEGLKFKGKLDSTNRYITELKEKRERNVQLAKEEDENWDKEIDQLRAKQKPGFNERYKKS
jgi:hypothetical protein